MTRGGHEPPAPLRVRPARARDPALVDLAWRSRTLHTAASALRADAPVFGDHVLDPEQAFRVDVRAARPAAVLLAFGADEDGHLSVLLTERAGHLSAHAGQVALPGGKVEPGETPAEAALRETAEEVGIANAALTPLGLVESYVTRSGFSVVPVVALVQQEAFVVPDPREVASVFTVPWARLATSLVHREAMVERDGVTRRFYETRAAGRRIWGVTAGIIKLVNDRLNQR